jgi:transposase
MQEDVMSLQPHDIPAVPETTAATAHAAFPRGNRYIAMRDELGTLYTDQDFATLFARRGQPAYAPWRLALVLVFQFAEGLSDEQAAEAVRARIDWKYALSLDLDDAGFDSSVLSEFRDRLIAGSLELHLLDAMLSRFKSVGLLKARGRQRTDSTHVLAAVRALNRLQCIGETVRQALNVLAVAAPDWLRAHLDPDWRQRYQHRFEEGRLPTAEAERHARAEQIGADGRTLLTLIAQPSAPSWLGELPALRTLRQVWLQQFYAVEPGEAMRWRAWADIPPAAQFINTPYDTEAHYSIKRTTVWTGYKVHLTESCDDELPLLITHVHTTDATAPDCHAVEPIHQALAAKEVLPAEHLLDAGYVHTDVIVSSQADHQVDLVGPVAEDRSWQARAGEGFALACFTFDWEAKVATCPNGTQSRKWSATHDKAGKPVINIRFDRARCLACPTRQQCTQSPKGAREITIRAQAEYETLARARKRQETVEWQAQYADRAGVEGLMSQGVRSVGLRKSRYIGLAKTHLQHVLTAAGLNLRRFGEWVAETPRARTRTPAFVRLMTAAP